MTHRIAYLPGDGIGPDVLAVARAVAEAAGLDAEWIEGAVGWEQWVRHGDALPDETLQLVRETDACLFGAITSQPERAAQAALPAHLRGKVRYQSPIVRLRQELGLGVNVRPARFCAGVPSPLADPPVGTTITVFRENTEDLYAGVEAHPLPPELAAALAEHAHHRPSADETAFTGRIITRRATKRVLEAAFAHAEAHGHPRVTLAEKANVMRATGGLVLAVAEEVAVRHPNVALDVQNADALAAALVARPEQYPVIVATNLFGDILSDLAGALTGGLALAPSANLGDRHGLFEPVHGSAPDIAGQGVANPIAAVLSAALMSRWLSEGAVAERIEAAVARVLADGPHTQDLGGQARTSAVEQALVRAVEGLSADLRLRPTA